MKKKSCKEHEYIEMRRSVKIEHCLPRLKCRKCGKRFLMPNDRDVQGSDTTGDAMKNQSW